MADSSRVVELPGSTRALLPGARRGERVDPEEAVEATILLRRGSPPESLPSLTEFGAQPPRGRTYWSREDLAAAHGARDDDLSAVRGFVESRGLRVQAVDRAGHAIHVGGRVREIAPAFGTELFRYRAPQGSFRGRVGPLSVPVELARVIVGVFGLDDRPQATTQFRLRPDRAAGAPSYTAPQVAAAYDFPPGTDGTGQSIGLIELGGGFRPADLQQYFQGLGIPLPTVTAVSVDGAANAPTGSVNGPDSEVALDIEVAGALAPGARIAVYFAPNTDRGFLDAVSTAVHDAERRPTIVSISWGGPENSWTGQARAGFDSLFQEAAALGVTVPVAAGDKGASDGGPPGTRMVNFPASDPGVLGCGGTRLVLQGTSVVSETVWNDLRLGEGGTGGGVSETFALPGYQTGVGVPRAPNGFVGRGVPDVAGDADPTTGYSVVVDGKAMVIGGTSAVAPLWAGLIARINQALQHPVGFVNAQLYAAGESDFRDITSGNNDGYTAGPGWSACTGLGAPNGSALLRALGGA